MDLFLQVDAELAVGADDDVGADAAFDGDVAVRVGEALVAGVVVEGDADLGAGG